MKERIVKILTNAIHNTDDIQLLTFFPVAWSFITSTFFLDSSKNNYIIFNYPLLYYGLITVVTLFMIISLFGRRVLFKQIFFLIMVFGGIYSAVNAYQISREPNITVGLDLYLTLNAAYGFIRMGITQRKLFTHV